MGLGAVVADLLPDTPRSEEPDENRCQQERDRERDAGSDEDPSDDRSPVLDGVQPACPGESSRRRTRYRSGVRASRAFVRRRAHIAPPYRGPDRAGEGPVQHSGGGPGPPCGRARPNNPVAHNPQLHRRAARHDLAGPFVARAPRAVCEPCSMQPRVQLHQVVPLVERQYAVIEHLRARHPKYTTVAQLADLVGVSPRTIERDAARLRAAGVPLDVVTGARGGYRVASREHDRSVSLTPGEVSALLAALVAVGPFTAGVAQSAFAKLIAALEVPPNQDRTPPQL